MGGDSLSSCQRCLSLNRTTVSCAGWRRVPAQHWLANRPQVCTLGLNWEARFTCWLLLSCIFRSLIWGYKIYAEVVADLASWSSSGRMLLWSSKRRFLEPLWSTKTLFSEHWKSVWEQISQFIIYLQFFISGKQKTKIHMAFSLLSIKYWSDNFSYKLEKYKFPQSITADKAIKKISLPHAFCLKTFHPPTPP